jgi:excisionase family DNA binding protein
MIRIGTSRLADHPNPYKSICESGFMSEEQQEQGSDNLEYEPRLDELMSLSEVANQTEISASHLRLLVRRGEVWGRKMGRNWVTTKAAVEQYLAQEHKTGPKPKQGPDAE